MSGRGSERLRLVVYAFFAIAFVLSVLQIWSAISIHQMVTQAETASTSSPRTDLEREKLRQESIAANIENQSKGLIASSLATQIGALLAALVTIVTAVLALRTYVDTREKERQDRLATTLSETLTRLAGADARQRGVGAAGLIPFFTKDRADFHLQALSALVAAARARGELPEVRQGIRLVVERALRVVAPEIVRQVSWQGVDLSSIDLSECDLRFLDLRDAFLEDAKLTGVRLDGANLSAAHLQGAKLDGGASLAGATLSYCDFAGATLAGASLAGAALDGIKVLDLALDGADFTSIGSGWRGVPWEATRDWRGAIFDAAERKELEDRYGPAVPPLKIVMLSWEVPPMVAGGTWTATYHLVRNLKRRGADVTVVVPWDRTIVFDNPFGADVNLVMLGIPVPDDGAASGPYGQSSWSPYGAPSQPWSPYGYTAPTWSPYASPTPYANPYASYGAYRASSSPLRGSILFRLIGEFRRRLDDYVRDNVPDVIHANDWVTFEAARSASSAYGTPWIAHFHSTEADRRAEPDALTEQIEATAAKSATRIVTPSEVTRNKVMSLYEASPDRVDVVPNVLSDGASSTSEMGRFETKRVVFLGRLTAQKGVDRFCAIAKSMQESGGAISFEAYGEGEDASLLLQAPVRWYGPLRWDQRDRAFRGASAILVPSRSEPFGMVILEAMQHRVPVLYPTDSGAAEVLQTGIKISPGDLKSVQTELERLLGSIEEWENTVRAQAAEIEAYPRRRYEDRLIAVWSQARRSDVNARA